MINVYDTCALLKLGKKILEKENVYITSNSLKELERIKSSVHKTEDLKAQARELLHVFVDHFDFFHFIKEDSHTDDLIDQFELIDNEDGKIIVNAFGLTLFEDDVSFITCDMACYVLAMDFAERVTKGIEGQFSFTPIFLKDEEYEKYSGYREVKFESDSQLDSFYSHLDENVYELNINEYLIIRDKEDEVLDIRVWDGETHRELRTKKLKCFTIPGMTITPKDEQQKMAVDSILNNTLTVISGKAGSGKSLISLASAFYLIDSGKYDKLVVFANGTEARGAAKIGFLPGTADQKVLGSSVGAMLASKFGDMTYVERAISDGKLELLPMVNCRGAEIGDNAIAFITETQNCTPDLLKLCLQRCSSGCKIIIEGDYESQVDSWMYEGENNGMRKAIEVFKNNPDVGIVNLPRTWRSKIAEMAEALTK